MGSKARLFAPQRSITIDDLGPQDHFYRHLDRALDLSFVRDLVRDCYAPLGRPSIDPIVFFKLHLVRFFEGIRSARQLEVVGADRLSVRWYLGYDLHQPLPDHSSLTRIRDHYGIDVFRQFFETGVKPCIVPTRRRVPRPRSRQTLRGSWIRLGPRDGRAYARCTSRPRARER